MSLVHDTAASVPPTWSFGSALTDQTVPFQRSIKVSEPARPTAKQLVGLVHDTPVSESPNPNFEVGFGLGTIDHVVPSQRSISVFGGPL